MTRHLTKTEKEVKGTPARCATALNNAGDSASHPTGIIYIANLTIDKDSFRLLYLFMVFRGVVMHVHACMPECKL